MDTQDNVGFKVPLSLICQIEAISSENRTLLARLMLGRINKVFDCWSTEVIRDIINEALECYIDTGIRVLD